MRTSKIRFSTKIKIRIALLYVLLVLMIVYAFLLGYFGYWNQSEMSKLALDTARVIYFGGMIYAVIKIHKYRKLLADIPKLKEKMKEEKDERNQYLHMASGGFVWDALLFIQLFLTLTASAMNETAFLFTMVTLVSMLVLKLGSFLYVKYGKRESE